MHKIINFFLWLLAISALIGSHTFASFYKISADDFKSIEGNIRDQLIITKDEYGNETSLKFYLENDELKYSLKGKLLERSAAEIYNLTAGQKVRVWIKKDEAKTFLDRFSARVDGVFGLEVIGGTMILPLETAIAYHGGSQSLVYMALFLIMALFIFSYIVKRHQQAP